MSSIANAVGRIRTSISSRQASPPCVYSLRACTCAACSCVFACVSRVRVHVSTRLALLCLRSGDDRAVHAHGPGPALPWGPHGSVQAPPPPSQEGVCTHPRTRMGQTRAGS
eukprot:5327771-Pyramimonas_sp.AAC.1